MWWGRLIGFILGFAVLHLPGAVLGFGLGYLFDRAYSNNGITDQVKQAFFNALFTSMGHLAKADGRVTESEIEMARGFMHHLRLDREHQLAAMRLFNQGKQSDFDLYAELTRLADVCKGRRNLLRMFMQMQFQAAYADGEVNQQELKVLGDMALYLGFTRMEFKQLHAMYKAQSAFGSHFHAHSQQQQQYSSSGYQSYQQARPSREDDLANARAILGVDATASQMDIKKAYRKQMNEYHPDKLVSKGLPDEMVKAATEKTQKIKEAYELLKKVG